MVRSTYLLVVLALSVSACSHLGRKERAAQTSGPPAVSVVFTSDVEGRTDRLARRATWVDRVRQEAASVVQVDAGNLFPTGGFDDARKAKVLLAAYARMGVDAITVGEGEIAFGPEKLKALARTTGVPIVASNLIDASGARVFESDRLVSAGTWTVGVFGIVAPSAVISRDWSSRWGIVTREAAAEARSEAASLRSRGAGIVVMLFNGTEDVESVRRLAKAAGGIDAVVVAGGAAQSDTGAHRSLLVVAADDGGRIGRIDVRGRRHHPRLDAKTAGLTADLPEQLGVGLLLRVESEPVLAHRMAANGAAAAPRYEPWTYASNEACGFCHKPEVAQWATTGHAQALASLRDSGKERDPSCLGCHMTGFLLPGGTQFVDTVLEQFADVGCESCHGASGAHVGSMDKRKGTSLKVDGTVCLGCHTPDQSVEPFDVAEGMKKILGPGHGGVAAR
jgi:hypothetical protein